MRLATIYALLDRSSLILKEHLLAGLAIWEYCEATARFVFGDSLGDPIADEIKRDLDIRPKGMTRTEIANLFKRNKSSNQIGRALERLLANGSASFIREETNGRPVERWFSIKHKMKT